MTYARAALGDAWDTVKSLSVGVDPYLPEVLCRVDQLRALSRDRTPLQALLGKQPTVPVPACIQSAPGQSGIGVSKVLTPVRAAVYLYQNPLTVWAGITAVLWVPFLLGYAVGSRR